MATLLFPSGDPTMTVVTDHNERAWSDLPIELLSLFIVRLLGSDIASFHSVCRRWRSVAYPIWPQPFTPSPSLSPLLMYFEEDKSRVKLYHPIYNTTYTMNTPELVYARIRFSKDGWLLMSQGKCIFFFNPFTKERIDLPDLPHLYSFYGITFSSPPTSPDCVVFGVSDPLGTTKSIDFTFIRHGEGHWTTCYVDNRYSFYPSCSNPVFHNGVFYCLGTNGRLGVFDPNIEEERNSWNVLVSPKELPCKSTKRSYLVLDHNGDLVSVLEGDVGTWVKVFKLDPSVMDWRMLTNLGNEMIFVSVTTSLATTNRSNDQVFGIENKIYYPMLHNQKCVFHSLATSKFHTFWDGYSSEDCYKNREKTHCTWIEPSFELHDHEGLQWYLPINESNQVKGACHPLDDPLSDSVITFVQEKRLKDSIEEDKEQQQQQQSKRSLPPVPRLDPWLVFFHGRRGHNQTFFSISENTYHVKNIPDMRRTFICTCSHGWLVLLAKLSDDCYLLNLLTMEKIQLPGFINFGIVEVCFLSSPPSDPKCTVWFTVRTKSGFVRIIYCHPGDKHWTIQDLELLDGQEYIIQVVAVGGKFYGYAPCCFNLDALIIIDLETTPCIKKVTDLPPIVDDICKHHDSLVESCDELFLVRKNYMDGINREFDVFKMDFGENIWVKVKSLGNRAFFLGDRNFCCSCSTKESGINDRDTIYFTLPNDRNFYEVDLEHNEIVATLPCPNVINNWTTPIWVSPLG